MSRKVEAWRPRKREMYRSIVSAERVHSAEAICIKVSREDGLFLTEDMVVTHNTNYEQPLRMALQIMEERFDALGKARPDIVFITDDAYGSMDADFMHEWNRVKDKTSLKCYGIAIGCDSSGALAAVSDNVREISALVSDPRNMADIFRTI